MFSVVNLDFGWRCASWKTFYNYTYHDKNLLNFLKSMTNHKVCILSNENVPRGHKGLKSTQKYAKSMRSSPPWLNLRAIYFWIYVGKILTYLTSWYLLAKSKVPKLWTEVTKIGHIFRKQSTLKIKKIIIKSWSPSLIFFKEKKIRKIPLIFDAEKWLL